MKSFVVYVDEKPNFGDFEYVECVGDKYIDMYCGDLFIEEIVKLTLGYIYVFKKVSVDIDINIDEHVLVLSQYSQVNDKFFDNIRELEFLDDMTIFDEVINNNLIFGFVISKKYCRLILDIVNKFGLKNLNELVSDLKFEYISVDGYDSNNLCFDEIVLIDNFRFYSRYDVYGYDVGHYDMPINLLVDIVNTNHINMGFNTLGYVKYNNKPPRDMIKLNNAKICDGYYAKKYDVNIKQQIKKICDGACDGYNITFTVTTCKRLDLFIHTMDNLLIKCNDIYKINKWICVDDNSSEEDRLIMKNRYPFFNFVWKDITQKGHAKSMNMIWDMVDTEYILHFEDDWFCNNHFTLKNLFDVVVGSDIKHLCLKKIGRGIHDLHYKNDIWKYVYNKNHVTKPILNKYYDIVFTNHNEVINNDVNYGWWWPGFTLNPSIINIKYMRENIGKFDENIRQELFEYDYAAKCFGNNVDVYYVNNDIGHIGEVSSYLLNNMNRYYDRA